MTLEALKAQIGSVRDLQSVVKTMKALAAVSIRQYQKAVESLTVYDRTVEQGFEILLKYRYDMDEWGIPSNVGGNRPRLGAIVFGSDQGLCGQFNEQIASYAGQWLDESEVPPEDRLIATVGERILPPLQGQNRDLDEHFGVPNSARAIGDRVRDLLVMVERWRSQANIGRVMLFYNQSQSGAQYHSRSLQLFPLDPQWLQDLESRPWKGNGFPTFTMDVPPLFSALIRQHLFVSLYRALAESLASENASRLSSMQSAEKNIQERLGDLNSQYRRQRQSSITGELLDVVSGFEALSS